MKRPLCLICLAFVVSIMLSMVINPPPSFSLEGKDGVYCVIEGKIYRKEHKENVTYIYINQIKALDYESQNNSSDRISTNQNRNNRYKQSQNSKKQQNMELPKGVLCLMKGEGPKIGAKILIRGKTCLFKEATNEGEFDQHRYWQIRHIDMQMQECKLLKQSQNYNILQEKMYQQKIEWEKYYETIFSEKQASVMKAMLLGNKREMNEDLKKQYQENGIAHMLAISGLHISIIGMGLFRLLRKGYVPIWLAAGVSMIVMLGYGVFTGMGSSTLRAIIMFLLQLLAKICKRSYDMLTAMMLSATLILMEQPLYLFDAGFLMSYSAILGVGLLYPAISYDLKEHPVLQVLAASVSVTLTTMPVIMYAYYEVPRYGIFLNMVLVPMLGLVILGGLLILLIANTSLSLGSIVALPCVFILHLYEKICGFMDQLPGKTCILGKPGLLGMICFYGMLLFIALFYEKIPKMISAMLIVTGILILTTKVNTTLCITAIDVGQGDGFCVQSTSGNAYLIDAGSSTKKKVATYQVIPYLKSQGIKKLRAVFVSHADSDHMNGVLELLDQSMSENGILVELLVVPYIQADYQDEGYQELLDMAEENQVPIMYMKSGDVIKDGKLQFTCLHPDTSFQTLNANATSNVLWISMDKFDALFTGDLEEDGERTLLQKLQRLKEHNKLGTIELLKVAHHGSKNSTSVELLQMIAPKVSFISCGAGNPYGHPHKELLKRLENLSVPYYMTSTEGALKLYTDGHRAWGYSYRNKEKYVIKCS